MLPCLLINHFVKFQLPPDDLIERLVSACLNGHCHMIMTGIHIENCHIITYPYGLENDRLTFVKPCADFKCKHASRNVLCQSCRFVWQVPPVAHNEYKNLSLWPSCTGNCFAGKVFWLQICCTRPAPPTSSYTSQDTDRRRTILYSGEHVA